MTLALVTLSGALGVVLVVLLQRQRDAAHRIRTALDRLGADVGVVGDGLDEATAAVERAVEGSLAGRAERSLTETRLASALDIVPQGIVLFAGGDVVFHNTAGGAYLTADPSVALVADAIEEVAQAVLRGRHQRVEHRRVELFGPPPRHLLVRGFPVDDPEGRGALVIAEDVTERQRLESVRRDFVANISHELKTPVGAISLLAETLATEDDLEVAQRLAGRIVDEAFRVGRTIDDLLELSRIEIDELDGREPVRVADVVAEAVDRVRGAAEQRRIRLDVDDVDQRVGVLGDRRQLVSATYNLLDNAVKYSDDGSVVRVRTRHDGRMVDLSIIDQGAGIPARDLERVFERFYRVDRARSRQTGGTGLGLAIVRHVATNHAGEVRVESQEGQGSTFTLRVPVAPGPAAVTDEAG